jgi:hypothetical protein
MTTFSCEKCGDKEATEIIQVQIDHSCYDTEYNYTYDMHVCKDCATRITGPNDVFTKCQTREQISIDLLLEFNALDSDENVKMQCPVCKVWPTLTK